MGRVTAGRDLAWGSSMSMACAGVCAGGPQGFHGESDGGTGPCLGRPYEHGMRRCVRRWASGVPREEGLIKGPPGPLCFLFFVFPSRPLTLTPPGRPLNGKSKTLGPAKKEEKYTYYKLSPADLRGLRRGRVAVSGRLE